MHIYIIICIQYIYIYCIQYWKTYYTNMLDRIKCNATKLIKTIYNQKYIYIYKMMQTFIDVIYIYQEIQNVIT